MMIFYLCKAEFKDAYPLITLTKSTVKIQKLTLKYS